MRMFLRFLFALQCVASPLVGVSAQAPSSPAAVPPARTVKGQVLTSAATPAVGLEFAKGFKYAGAQDFILYDVARAEQHFFVDADNEGRIRRLYWVQFEGYLPTNTHTYRYQPTKTVEIGGLTFIADSAARNMKINVSRPDSDGSRARAFLESKGYGLPSDVLWQRLVHLVDDAKRNELMIIYMEDLSAQGMRASDLWKGGQAESQWDDVARRLLDRAVQNMKIRR